MLAVRKRSSNKPKHIASGPRRLKTSVFFGSARGTGASETAQNKAFRVGPSAEAPPRVDVSTRTAVAAGPSDGAATESASTAPRTLRDELAEVIARAVREGRFDLASKLVEAAALPDPPSAGVVDLQSERVKRGGA
jgi:hypothetical protein